MEIRPAIISDYDAYARLMPELGVDDAVPPAERFASELVHRMIVAVDGETIIGYALFEVMRDVGYVRNVVADPARRRSGIGRTLMEALRTRFASGGATAWCLNVKPTNTGARALYERCGMRTMYHSWSMRLAREVQLALPTTTTIAPIDIEEDAVVERTFQLLPGQLASSRLKSGRHILKLVHGDQLAGVAVFAVSIPGAFPLRVIEPALGPAFVAHLRSYVPDGAAYIQIVVEGDSALRDALVASRFAMHMEIVHMRGQL